MKALNVALIAVFIAIGAAACSSDDEQTVESQLSAAVSATPTPAPTPLSTESPSPPLTPVATGFDYSMADIAAEAPGFAGMLLDPVDNNILLVKTTKPETDVSVYKAAIVARFPEMSSKRFELINATYDFAQLSEWYALIDPLYGLPGLVYTDVDEVRNKIVIGVETEADRGPMEQKIAELPIPPEAIEVVVTGPSTLL
jgi:hypothetical protein